MWLLENETPFAAERSWVRDKNGAEVWLVVVRAAFLINPDGSTTPAKEQDEVCLVPKYRDKPNESSLLYESDLIHTKPTTDVILHGSAYAPQQTSAIQVDVTLKLANIVKTLRVFGDRYWEKSFLGLKISQAEPFQKKPIIYERAFGGMDNLADHSKKLGWEPRNPVGTGFAVKSEHLVDQLLPNVEYPNHCISSWKQRPSPAGFGPIASTWSPRLAFAGTYDDKWQQERMPLLPEDFSEKFYLCAPEDQQTPSYLKGGEWVMLYNLTPQGFLRFALPQMTLVFNTYFKNETISHSAKLHTVILEPNFPRVILVWHTHLACHHKGHQLEATIITQE